MSNDGIDPAASGATGPDQARLAQLDLALAPLRPRAAGRLDRALAPLRPRAAKPLPRERTKLAAWFWEIDRVLLALIVVLIMIGLVAVAAASPVGAIDRSTSDVTVNSLHYFYRQLMWIGAGLAVMIAVSMFTRVQARRFAVGLAIVFGFCLVLVQIPHVGTNIGGATRWLGGAALRFQPSEFLKPMFVVAVAWLLSLKARDPSLPVVPLTFMLTAIVALLLMRQPDFGQTVMFCAMWAALLLMAGESMRLMGLLGLGGVVLFVLTYLFYDNGRERINSFLGLNPDTGGGPDQVALAHATITHGGLFGVGPGGGTAKFNLPEAHTDYIFSVIGEEFGLIACIAIALLYFAIAARVLLRLLDEDDPFIVLAAGGLAVEMTLQAIINMGVNTQLFPSKGMTLPFISYGGSSMIALCAGIGLLLAFTRRNPYMARSSNVVKRSGR